MVSPTDIVQKFINESNNVNKELSFVAFIDGNEEKKSAFFSDETEFIKSINRPKSSFQLD